jgi:PAS domain-containing protein
MPMKSKTNTKKPIAELEAGPSLPPELETATGDLYKSLFELSPTGIATIDLKGKITACNPAILNIGKSYSKDEIVGKYFWNTPALRAGDCCQSAKWDTFQTEHFGMIRRH